MLDFRNANEVFSVYGLYPRDGKVETRLLGRFIVANGKLSIIEDHDRLMKVLTEGPVEGENERKLNAMAHSSYMKVVPEGEIQQGKHVDLLKERDFGGVPRHMRGYAPTDMPQTDINPETMVETPDAPQAPQEFNPTQFTIKPPPGVFDYLRVGMAKPDVIEVHGDDVWMNGHKLDREEIERILETVHTGLATIRYRRQ